MNKKVNYQFKLLYAIGMVLVVANHCGNGGVSLFYEFFPAYSFHVGLFVFSSGYFYKECSEDNIGKYIIRKIKKLIIPLYLWNFVYALFAQVMSTRGFSFGTGVTINKLFILPITDGHQYVYNLCTWFLVPLFLVEVFNVLYRKLIVPSKISAKYREYLYIAGALALGMLGIWLATEGYNTGWWLVLTRTLHLIPFYCGGFFYQKILEDKDTLPNSIYFALVIGIQLMIIIYKGGTLTYSQAWSGFREFAAWPYVVGFLAIAFWLRVTRILEPVIGKSKIVNLIADNTFSIMVNQFLGFMLVKSVFAFFYVHTNTLFQDFNWKEYHSNPWYYYFPKGLSQTGIIYIVASIAIAIAIQKAIDKVKEVIDRNKKERKPYVQYGIYVCIILVTLGSAKLIANYVAASGGVTIPAINNYILGSTLYFDKDNANVNKYCISGFSGHEKSFTWTDGKEAWMSFVINGIDSDLKISITCGAYGESQNVDLYVNDYLTDSLIISKRDTYEIIVPKEYIDGPEINLKFGLPDAASPAQNGGGADVRLLGLSMESIMIDSD